MTNPFESPTVQPVADINSEQGSGASTDIKIPAWLSNISFVCPFLFPASLYTSWLVAWAHLGHAPRPMLDDPKSIGIVVNLLCLFTGVILLMFPGMFLFGVFAQLLLTGKSWLIRVVRTVLLIAIWCGLIVFLRYDVGNVVEWFID